MWGRFSGVVGVSYEKRMGPKRMLKKVWDEYPALVRDPHLDVSKIWRSEVGRIQRGLEVMIWVEFNVGVGAGRRAAMSAARSMSNFYAKALADLDRKQYGREVEGAPINWIEDPNGRRLVCDRLDPGEVPWANGWDPLRELSAWLRRARLAAWSARGPVAAYGARSRMKGKSALIVIVLGRELAAIEKASTRLARALGTNGCEDIFSLRETKREEEGE